MSTRSRAYGFAPLFGDPFADQRMRVSDAERQVVADRLAEHFAEGRLDQAEFDERVARAMSAKTRADLHGLFDDLPEPGGQRPGPAQAPMPAQPHRHGHHPVLLTVLIVLVVLAAAHALFAGPWLWLGLIVAAVLFVTRGTRHTRARQDREGA